MTRSSPDVFVIGAGPAGAVAAALLCRRGWRVEVVERDRFPRFSIGESLLPQAMVVLEEAGLLPDVAAAGFQRKDGAAFHHDGMDTAIHFRDKRAEGPATTFQVQRDRFDTLLAEGAARQGATVRFGEQVVAFASDDDGAHVTVRQADGSLREVRPRFVLDGSGYGRVLSRLLGLERPTTFPERRAVFCHVRTPLAHPRFDRDKILITINQRAPSVWYWLIPLAGGLASIGAVGPTEEIAAAGTTEAERLWTLVHEVPYLGELLGGAEVVRPEATIGGYACRVSQLAGPGYALLGNAAEFLDPIFSSGVTIALKSASLAAGCVDRQLRGEAVDWEASFAAPLQVGVETFRACVDAWYAGRLQRIIMNRPDTMSDAQRMLISVLAGYAWDANNAIVRAPVRMLRLLDEYASGLVRA